MSAEISKLNPRYSPGYLKSLDEQYPDKQTWKKDSNRKINIWQYEEFNKLKYAYDIPTVLPTGKKLKEQLIKYDEVKDTYITHAALDDEQKVIVKYTTTGEREIIMDMYNEPEYYYKFNEVLNEAFVGLFGLKNLNIDIFSKVLDANINQKCHYVKDRCNYVVYELIEGVPLLEYIKSATEKSMKNILLSLFIGLNKAYNIIEFTHYDLHLENIMINNKGDPIIIDYGSSHIKFGGINYGRELMEGNIFNKPLWVHDILKLCLSILYETDNEVYEQHAQYNWYIKSLRKNIKDNNIKISKIKDLINHLEGKLDIQETKKERNLRINIAIRNVLGGKKYQETTVEGRKMTEKEKGKVLKYLDVHTYEYNIKEQIIGERHRINNLNKENNVHQKNIDRLEINKPPPREKRVNIGSMMRELCSFFDNRFLNAKYIVKYMNNYKYNEPSTEIIDKNLNFDDFIDFALPYIK